MSCFHELCCSGSWQPQNQSLEMRDFLQQVGDSRSWTIVRGGGEATGSPGVGSNILQPAALTLELASGSPEVL